MVKLNFERFTPFNPEQMLSLVADIKSYPDFVPHCSDMQIKDGERNNICYATMFVSFGPVSQSYTSKVIIDREQMSISASAIDGPFSHLDSKWQFLPGGAGTKVIFNIDFGFSNRLLGKIAEPIFTKMQNEIVNAFINEAKRRYF